MTYSYPRRLASIDVFRAVTMMLMIFVNDLWSVRGFPEWLDHASRNDDALGFADTVFPAFLFIVGLSIPLAITARLSKGHSKTEILKYIGTRVFALLVMGFFHVNLENYNDKAALMLKPWWQIFITIGFFLVWLDYSPAMARKKKWALQCCGVVLLVAMACIYKGGTPDSPTWMRPAWWGILGLIGWAYLLCAAVYLYAGNNFFFQSLALLFFLFFNFSVNAGWLDTIRPLKKYIWITGDGAMPALAMAGVLVSTLYRRATDKGWIGWCMVLLTAIALAMLYTGFLVRPCWGISKIRATPSWVMICTAISIGCFMILIFLTDIKNKERWFAVIKPGGTSTLTAYLLPYLHYALYNLLGAGIALPLLFKTGIPGLIKSLLYAVVIIVITGLLEKKRIRLKI